MSVPTPFLPAAETAPAFAMGVPVMFLPDALQACVEAGTCWQQEIARFVDRRLAETLRCWQAVSAARDVAGLVKAQQDWSVKAAADYAEEARRMQQLVTTLSLTGTTPAVQESARLLG
ncbi:MAG: hypothetical protein Q8L22_21745 [Reyranella sp.]|nr:hypothetical protein [Reyranella sp.]